VGDPVWTPMFLLVGESLLGRRGRFSAMDVVVYRRGVADATADPEPVLDARQAREILPHLEARRHLLDSEVGNVPGLLVAAQAFLYAVGLNPDVPRVSRVIVLAVGLAPLLAAWQMLAKKRYLEELHSEAIAHCRAVLGLPEIRRGQPGSLLPEARIAAKREAIYQVLVIAPKGHRLWQWAFAAFVVADLALIALTCLGVG
jgi:hypothetical protein